MKKKIFGFDLGIASIGWAVVEFDKENYDPETGEIIEGKIIRSGVRTFPIAENPKDGSSLAAPRREKRLARRIIRRKARRMEGIKNLFVVSGLAQSREYLEKLYMNQKGGDVWNLRVAALSRKLEKDELLRILTHLAKHRGFKSYRKAEEEKDAEGGKVLKAIKANKELLSSDKTLAQIIVERAGMYGKKRNCTKKDAKGKDVADYYNSIPRDQIISETEKIFEYQKQFGVFNEKLLEDFKKIAFRYRPVGAVGDMVGNCRFEKEKKRAPKEAPSSELFVALGKINNLMVTVSGERRFLNSDEKTALLELLRKTKDVKYSTIRRIFGKNADVKFDDIDYSKTEKKNKKTGEITEIKPEDVKFYSMKGWHKLKEAFDSLWDDASKDLHMLDRAMTVIACQKNDIEIEKGLKEEGIKQEYIEILKNLTTDKFINLSLKALYNINPHLEEGFKYNEACEKAGYDFKDTGEKLVERGKLLAAIPVDKLTKVPAVNRTVAQFRKVYNAMVRAYGEPDQINLEVGRELKKNHEERQKIIKQRDENEEERKEAAEYLKGEKGIADTGKNILKYRLYQQQNGKCIYSGKPLDLQELDNYEVDHILPYSRSLDNGFNNKVLCLRAENQAKGNKTPYEYLKQSERWKEFKTIVLTTPSLGRRKKENLLNESFSSEENELKFRERNSNDNSYIARFVNKYLNDGIDFSESDWKDIKNRVQVRNGALTDYLRNQWGLKKDRNENDRHHAQDAIVIACATQGMVKYLSTVSAMFENKYELTKKNGEVWYKALKQKFREPWSNFRNDVLKSLEEVFVSRPPRKKARGAVHKETIYSQKEGKGSLPVRGGLAEKDNMFRCDIFKKEDQHVVVPIFVADIINADRKDVFYPPKFDNNNNQLAIDGSYEFLMSLYKDDYVKIKTDDNKEYEGYIVQINMPVGQFIIESFDNANVFSISTQTFEVGDIIVLKGKPCKVEGYNTKTKKLQAISLDRDDVLETDAVSKTNRKGEATKNIETSIRYIKLDPQKKINIGTFREIVKCQIGVLGEVSKVGKEQRVLINKENKKEKKD